MLPGFTPSLHYYGGVYASGGSADWPEITCWATICLNWIFKIFTNFSVFVFVFLALMRSLICQDWMCMRANNLGVGGRRGGMLEIRVYLSYMTTFGSHAKPGRRQPRRRRSREEFFHCWRRRQASSKMFDCSQWNLSAPHSPFCRRLSLSLFQA